jgi:putative membrane protein
MLLGIVGGVFGLSYLLANFPLEVWGFFFGLIVASAIYVGKQVSGWSLSTIVILIVTALLAYGVTVATPASGSESLAYVFLCGVIAISALMLPGLSGSFMLLLLGMYQFILHDTLKEGILENQDFGAIITLGAFGLGCLLGVLTFARVLTWLFNHYRNFTLAGLTGFMIGSLNKVWPWQEVLSTRMDSKGVEKVLFSKSVLPSRFSELSDNFLYGNDTALVGVIVAMLVGFALIFLIEGSGNAEMESGV